MPIGPQGQVRSAQKVAPVGIHVYIRRPLEWVRVIFVLAMVHRWAPYYQW